MMSTVQIVSQTVNTLSVAELEELIRRIVREEIALALDERDIYGAYSHRAGVAAL